MFNTEKVLFICLSTGWSTRERSALRSAVNFELHRGEASLYCLKDSSLDAAAKRDGVKRIYCQRGSVGRIYDLYNFFEIQEILKKGSYSIVHCFDEYSIWSVCLILKGRPLIPLFFSLFRESRKQYRYFWHKFLFSRVDHLLVNTSELITGAIRTLPIKNRKIEHMGLGVNIVVRNSSKSIGNAINKKNSWLVGSVVENSCDLREQKGVTAIINMLVALKNKKGSPPRKSLKCFLFISNVSQERIIRAKLRSLFQDFNLGDDILITSVNGNEELMHLLDVWIGIDDSVAVSDFTISAMCCGVPLLLPRSGANLNLLGSEGLIGESYMLFDARELREKCSLILKNYKKYKVSANLSSNKAVRVHNLEKVKRASLTLYSRSIVRRKRLFARHSVNGLT